MRFVLPTITAGLVCYALWLLGHDAWALILMLLYAVATVRLNRKPPKSGEWP